MGGLTAQKWIEYRVWLQGNVGFLYSPAGADF
jgi:hypothetical protein